MPFVLVNPLLPEQQRVWESAVFLWAGLSLAAVAVADSFALKSLVMWLFAAALLHRSPASFQFVLFVLGGLGFYAIARQNKYRNLIRVIAVSMTIAMALQAAGFYESIAQLIVPSYKRIIYNDARALSAMTASTGDAGVVLAMAVPYFTEGIWWLFLPGILLALSATKALSAIIAAACGLIVVCFPYALSVHRQMRGYSRGLAVLGWTMAVAFIIPLINRIDPIYGALTDERWSVWWIALKRWAASDWQLFWTGYGPGSWKFKFPLIAVGNKLHHWQQAHFDILQFAFEVGAVGLMLLCLVGFETIWRAHHRKDAVAVGGMVALIVAQFGHFPWHLGVGGVMSVLVFADARRNYHA